jgi:hypothetical protein
MQNNHLCQRQSLDIYSPLVLLEQQPYQVSLQHKVKQGMGIQMD